MAEVTREMREFTTPLGHKIIFNAYLTGRESVALKEVMLSAMKMGIKAGEAAMPSLEDISGAFLVEQEKKALGFLLISIDGDKSNPLENLLDLPSSEYDAVVAEANKLRNPSKPENSA